MSALDDLDGLLADLDDAAGGATQGAAGAPAVGGEPAPGAEDIASRLAAMQQQGDMMKDLLASDDEEGGGAAQGAAGAEDDVAALLGEASRMIDAGAASRAGAGDAAVPAQSAAASDAGYDDEGFESSPVSSPGTSVSSARPAAGQPAPQPDALSSCPATSSPPSSAVTSSAVSAAPSAAPGAPQAGDGDDGDGYDEGFESDEPEQEADEGGQGASAQGADAGISIHQMQASAVAGDDEEDYGDEDYEDEDFEEDLALPSADARTQSDHPPSTHAETSRALVHAKAAGPPIAQQLELLQSEWMKEGSMQQRIYRVAVTKLAKSILMDVLNHGIDAHDERKRREEAIAARKKREAEVNFAQVHFVLCERRESTCARCHDCLPCTWDPSFTFALSMLTCYV